MLRQNINNRVGGFGVNFGGVGVFHMGDVSCEFNGGQLHAVAKTKEGDFVFSGIADGFDFTFHPSRSESARDNHSVEIPKFFDGRWVVFIVPGVQPSDGGLEVLVPSGVFDGFDNREIRIAQREFASIEVFTDDADFDFFFGAGDFFQKFGPRGVAVFSGFDAEFF